MAYLSRHYGVVVWRDYVDSIVMNGCVCSKKAVGSGDGGICMRHTAGANLI